MSNSVITTPTFNIEGTTSSNALVEIIESSPTNQILGSGLADGSGQFSITIQPDFSYYEEENVILYASSNVRVGNSILSKSSSTISIDFSIQDYQPIITTPSTLITVYEPTYNITGLAMPNEAVHLVESNVLVSTTAATGSLIDHRNQFSFIETSPITSSPEQKDFMVTTNVYGLDRNSNTVSIIFDVYKPQVSFPITDTTIVSPTINFQGTTEPNTTVEIHKKPADGTYTLLTQGLSDNNGNFNILIQPIYTEYNLAFSFIASASINVSGVPTPKISDEINIQFNIPDYPPEITFPTETITVYEPTFNITGLAMADELVHLVESNLLISSTPADGDLINGRKEFSFIETSPITATSEQKSYMVTSNVYGLERSTGSVDIIFDVYKPQISFPTDNIIIVTPTHNFQGITEPNTMVEVYKKTPGGAYTLVNQGEADANGEFSILVQPIYTEYDQTYEFIASASITVSGTPTTKLSDEITVNFNIPDFPPTLTSPITGAIIYRPTFNMIGEAREDRIVNVYEDDSFKESGIADILPINSGLKEYNVIVDSPQTITPTDYEYFVSTNVYELPRKTQDITLTFDLYNPNIEEPVNNSLFDDPRFTMIGYTEPGVLVEIYKNDKLFDSTYASSSGTYNVNLRYDFDEQVQIYNAVVNQVFFASANVLINGDRISKQSTPKTYTFDVPDIRPLITAPTDNTIITTKRFDITGVTGAEIPVLLYENDQAEPILTTTSNSDGEFEFTIGPECGDTNDPPVTLNYKVVANVYGMDYTSPSINVYNHYDYSTPIIYYPLNNTTIESNRITFRGEAPPTSNLIIYESDNYGENGLVIGSVVSNELCEWEFEIPIKNNGTTYYIGEYEKILNEETSYLYTEQIQINSAINNLETFIETPENYDEVTTSYFDISGISTKNSTIEIYFETNIEGDDIDEENIVDTKTLLTTTSSNEFGRWSISALGTN